MTTIANRAYYKDKTYTDQLGRVYMVDKVIKLEHSGPFLDETILHLVYVGKRPIKQPQLAKLQYTKSYFLDLLNRKQLIEKQVDIKTLRLWLDQKETV